jgi:hypothetical protein
MKKNHSFNMCRIGNVQRRRFATGVAVILCWLGLAIEADATYVSTVTGDNPVAYWRLGEAANTDPAADEIAPTVDGSYTSGISVGLQGIPGAAPNTSVGFDNSSNVRFPDNDKFDFGTGDFSIEAWAKTPDTDQPDRIIAKDDGAGWQIRIESRDGRADTNKGLFFIRGGGAETSVVSTSDVNDDQWHHLVTVRESGELTLYVDGVPEVTGVAFANSADSANDLFIGTFNNASGNAAFAGLIDETALYTHALSPTQVAAHYAAGIPEPATLVLLIGGAALLVHLKRR